MADGFFPTLVSRTENQNAVANPIYTQLTDGTDVAVISATGGVNTAVESVIPGTGATNLGKAEDSAHASGDVGVMGLAVRQDTPAPFGADGDYVPLVTNATGDLRTTLDGEIVSVSKNGTINSSANPIFVQTVNSGASSTEVQDYDTATVAGGASSNHDYTVVGTTFFLREVLLSASGGAKAEIQAGPIATLVTYAVIFIPKHGGSERWTPPLALEVPVTGTGTVRVIRTNREGASQDLYSTIVGDDV